MERDPTTARVGLLIALAACSTPGDREGKVIAELQEHERLDVLEESSEEEDESRISDEVLPPQVDALPDRPAPILEIGDPLLGTGPIQEGVKLPTGAVWQPDFTLFGEYRTALQSFRVDGTQVTEWANRLDIFGNLQLSGTERLVFGFRPLDEDGGFSGYTFSPDELEGWDDGLNAKVQTLFFEGEIGEIFPKLDPEDRKSLDLGFSIGRQPILLQEGLLVEDSIDSFGLVRNSLMASGTPNLRLTGLFAWGNMHRGGEDDDSARLLGLSGAADVGGSTVTADLLGVLDTNGESDAIYGGIGSVQRLGHLNTTFRGVGSLPVDGETREVGEGALLLAEVSRSPFGTDDLAYVNAYAGLGRFTSASRRPESGGPLGRVGILFEAVQMGRWLPPLSNVPDDSVGAAVGYQWFLGGLRKQVVLEAGARFATDDTSRDAAAIGTRYEQAIGRRTIFRTDAYLNAHESEVPGGGLRVEFRIKF